MTAPELLEAAERAIAHAGGEAQATVMRERSLTSRFARSTPTQATGLDRLVVEVLAVRDGQTAAATTTSLDDDALRACARRATTAAETAARAASGEYPGLPSPQPAQPHGGWDAATAALEPSIAGSALGAAFTVAAEQKLEAFGIWTTGEVRLAVASSAGTRATDAVTDAHMRVTCRDPDGRSGFGADTAAAASALDAPAIARRAAAKVPRGEIAELEAGEYPVVLEADAVGELLTFLGWLAFDGQGHAEGRGALADKLGSRVAAPAINLSDSPRFAATLPRSFDAEGVPKAPLPLIQDGIAHRVCHDTRSAARAGGGARSTGHALKAGGSDEGILPTNLVLVGGGAADEAELAAPIERGLLVTRFWYVNTIHPKRTLLTGMTRDGTYLIEDGVVSRPVRDVRFTDEALRILSATEALTARPRLVSEADFYGPRFAFGVVCPALRAQGFRVTGATTA